IVETIRDNQARRWAMPKTALRNCFTYIPYVCRDCCLPLYLVHWRSIELVLPIRSCFCGFVFPEFRGGRISIISRGFCFRWGLLETSAGTCDVHHLRYDALIIPRSPWSWGSLVF
ncbi:unnamed protein product, partial [Pylaiella littoralis]